MHLAIFGKIASLCHIQLIGSPINRAEIAWAYRFQNPGIIILTIMIFTIWNLKRKPKSYSMKKREDFSMLKHSVFVWYSQWRCRSKLWREWNFSHISCVNGKRTECWNSPQSDSSFHSIFLDWTMHLFDDRWNMAILGFFLFGNENWFFFAIIYPFYRRFYALIHLRPVSRNRLVHTKSLLGE